MPGDRRFGGLYARPGVQVHAIMRQNRELLADPGIDHQGLEPDEP